MAVDTGLIGKRLQYLQELWKPAHQKWDTIDLYLHAGFQLWENIPKASDWPKYYPSKPWSIFNKARNRMTTAVPRFTRPPTGESEKAEESADQKCEPWITGGVKHMMGIDPAFIGGWGNLMAYGYCQLIGPVLDSREVARYKEGKRTWWPARMRAPHPATALIDPLDQEPDGFFQFKTMPAYALRSLLQQVKEKRPNLNVRDLNVNANPYETLAIVEHWTLDEHMLFVWGESGDIHAAANPDTGGLGEDLFSERNLAGYLPIFQTFSYWGQPKRNAPLDEKVSQMCEGVLDHSMEDLKAFAQMQTAKVNMLLENAFFPLIVKSNAPGVSKQMDTADVAEVPDGEITRIPSHDLADGSFEFSSEVQRNIEETTYNVPIGSYGERGVTTVGQTAIVQGEENKQFAVPRERMNAAASFTGSSLLRLQEAMIEHYQTPMVVNGKKVTAADIDGDYTVEGRFEVVDVVLKMQGDEQAATLQANHQISRHEMWRRMGIENVTELENEMLDDIIDASPEVMAENLAARAKARGLKQAATMFSKKAAQFKAQREMAMVAPTGGNGTGGGGPMPSEQPTNPVRDMTPAGQGRRLRTGIDSETAKPAPRSSLGGM